MLTPEQAKAVLDEGLALYNEEENKKQIDAAIAAAGGDQAKLMATATPLALTIGKPLLEKYGFTADPMGFMMLITSLTMATAADPVLKAQLADLQAKVMPRAA